MIPLLKQGSLRDEASDSRQGQQERFAVPRPLGQALRLWKTLTFDEQIADRIVLFWRGPSASAI
jgi:hypothetical protein